MRNEAVIAQLTRGSIAKTLFTLTIPMIFSAMGMSYSTWWIHFRHQARFMIPMAISLGFGVLFATLTTLILAKLRLPGPYRPGTGKTTRREEHNFLWGTCSMYSLSLL